MRATSSCTACRLRKKKCIIPEWGQSCKLCVSRRLECNLAKVPSGSDRGASLDRLDGLIPSCPGEPSAEPSSTLLDGTGVSSRVTQDGLPATVCDDLVDLYFDLIHDKQHILFHRDSFIADQRAGRAPSFLVLGMIALAARFSSNPYFQNTRPWDRAKSWYQKAMSAFNSRSVLIDIPSLQGSVLLGFVAFVEGDNDQDALLSAQAICMVQMLRLPVCLSSDPIQREVEIRLFWQCWMMDAWHTSRLQLPRRLNDSNFKRPLEECAFNAMQPGDPASHLSEADIESLGLRKSGLWSSMLALTEIHNQVVMLNDQIVQTSIPYPAVRRRVAELSIKLDLWLGDLPSRLLNTVDNRESHAKSGLGREFAILHLLYHHQAQLLYYQFLNKGSTSTGADIDHEAVQYAGQCKAHAAALSKIMWDTNSTPGMECLWSPVNGHLLVVSSSIHLHTLLFSNDDTEITKARMLLEQNFIILLHLQKYWPFIEFSMSRLRAFHQVCQMNATEKNFDMDRWMIKFLNRYGSRVQDRYSEFGPDLDESDPIVGTPAAAALWKEISGSEFRQLLTESQ
ncbi:transcriptional regulator family: Fungal Specific TF [Paecilomyces variotii]|nr:transcriptional regulator family: Fungal Specific TF [Paecilomyces variotii]